MKRWLLLLLLPLLTACSALPGEERSFAVALGVSGGEGAWTLHARIPTYQSSGGYATVVGEGDSLSHAFAALDAAAPMQLHMGQTRLIVFSAEAACSQAFPAALEELAEMHTVRSDAALGVTREPMGAVMEALVPPTGKRLSKSLDELLQTRISQGSVLAASLADVLQMGERQQAVLMDLRLEGERVLLSGGWPLNAQGQASQRLPAEDVALIALMQGHLRQGTLPLAEGVLRLTEARAEAELEGPTLQRSVVRLHLRHAGASLTDEALSQAVAAACLGVLGRLSAMGCDALGLARQAISHAQSLADWHELDWPARYRDMEWSVSVGLEGPTQ